MKLDIEQLVKENRELLELCKHINEMNHILLFQLKDQYQEIKALRTKLAGMDKNLGYIN